MDPFVIFLIVVITIITIVLAIVGIQLIFILRNINHTLTKANQTISSVDEIIHHIKNPLSDLKSLGQGVRTGLQVAEHVVSWVKEKKSDQQLENGQ